MISEELITIIVPVYNQRDYLPQCVDSLLAQTYANLEIILVDDGSTDGTDDMCDECARKDGRIVVHHQPNSGVCAARNWGLDHAHGQYVGFVDSDDWIEPNMYEWLHQQITLHGTDIVACGIEEQRTNGTVARPCKLTEHMLMDAKTAFRCMIKGCYFNGWLCNKLYRSTILGGDPPTRMPEDVMNAEDQLFNSELFARGATLFYEPLPLYHYRIHAQSAMHIFDGRRRTAFIAWQRIVDLSMTFDGLTQRYAKAMYSQTAAIYRARARKQRCKNEERYAKKEIWRYGNALLACKDVGNRTKFRFVMMVLFPTTSEWLWGVLRECFHLKWTAVER
ncbi:MAG: glycosyltransferase family A protein [Candidatus Limiplasma sp.]|nr:glycosyltransferase family A protein [Candidatus Limiplasma sp.]